MEYHNLKKAIDVIAKLRHPQNGCPWDLEQTHQSLLKYLVEESYEYIHAVEEKNPSKMEEELGDVLLQVLLHSQIASENNHFDIDSVAKVLAEKMIHRHPHVFEDKEIAKTPEQVTENWKKLKNKKKKFHINVEDAYAPSLSASYKIGEKSQTINFDWDNIASVMEKVEEELLEVKEEIKNNNHQKTYEEIGDLLFSVAQLARHLNIDPEAALKDANLKFVKRINLVEKRVSEDGKKMNKLPTATLEEYWVNVKKDLNKN